MSCPSQIHTPLNSLTPDCFHRIFSDYNPDANSTKKRRLRREFSCLSCRFTAFEIFRRDEKVTGPMVFALTLADSHSNPNLR